MYLTHNQTGVNLFLSQVLDDSFMLFNVLSCYGFCSNENSCDVKSRFIVPLHRINEKYMPKTLSGNKQYWSFNRWVCHIDKTVDNTSSHTVVYRLISATVHRALASRYWLFSTILWTNGTTDRNKVLSRDRCSNVVAVYCLQCNSSVTSKSVMSSVYLILQK